MEADRQARRRRTGRVPALGPAVFVRAERWIYFWDHGGYRLQALRMCALLLDSPAGWANELWRSMDKNVHDLLHAVPVSLALLPAGESRLAYGLAMRALYPAPALQLLPSGRLGSIELG